MVNSRVGGVDLMPLSRLRLLSLLLVAGGLCACPVFRGQEIPQILYVVKVIDPDPRAACGELVRAFADQTALKEVHRNPYSVSSGNHCDVTLDDAGGNRDEASVSWGRDALRIVVRRVGLGHRPNDQTIRLADQLIEIVRGRYPTAVINREKVLGNPFFGP